MPSPCGHPLAAAVRGAVHRELQAVGASEQPVATPAELQTLIAFHLVGKPDVPLRTRMYVTAAALCFAGLLRFSDLRRVLVHHNLMRFYPDRVELFLYAGKTDQHFKGALVPIGRGKPPYCPVALLEELLRCGGYRTQPETAVLADGREVEVHDAGPLIRAVRRAGGSQRLAEVTAVLPAVVPAVSYNTFAKGLGELFEQAGVRRLPTHALRRGGATAAVNGGADRILVQKLGRWRSNKVFEFVYVRDDGGRSREVTLCMGLGPEMELDP